MRRPFQLDLRCWLLAPLLLCGLPVHGAETAPALQRQQETLGRGAIAQWQTDGTVRVSWRVLTSDGAHPVYEIYRAIESEPEQLVTTVTSEQPTLFVDQSRDPLQVPLQARYHVRLRGASPSKDAVALPLTRPYLEIPVPVVEGYRPGDLSIGDLDGDGVHDFVLHQCSNAKDNSFTGITGEPILDAITLHGKHLWRIRLGKNIREGEHYTQFLVYDLDGDGIAEVVCKTADGTIDGTGHVIGDADRDWRDVTPQSRTYGKVLRGPEYLTVFDGRTGAELKTVDYLPGREPIDGWGGIGGNGGNDNAGNRCDRFLACVAYLDGKRPSFVMCRGVYGRTVLVAWDWRNRELTRRWVFDSGTSYPPYRDASPYSGMGGHTLGVADVDEDGRDEIIYQAMVIDDQGEGLYSTGLRHGDALYVTDIDPVRPGLEVFTIQENEEETVRFRTPGAAMRDARTGEILWSHSPGVDVPNGMVADIDPRFTGYEVWGGPGGLRTADGVQIGPAPRSTQFALWWDGDVQRELWNRSRVIKWNWAEGREETLLTADGRGGSHGPLLVADLLGDWREEFVVASSDGRHLRLYVSTEPTTLRFPCLLQDSHYRLSVVLQNVGYNKPPQLSYALKE